MEKRPQWQQPTPTSNKKKRRLFSGVLKYAGEPAETRRNKTAGTGKPIGPISMARKKFNVST